MRMYLVGYDYGDGPKLNRTAIYQSYPQNVVQEAEDCTGGNVAAFVVRLPRSTSRRLRKLPFFSRTTYSGLRVALRAIKL